jgi:hypothetical protein
MTNVRLPRRLGVCGASSGVLTSFVYWCTLRCESLALALFPDDVLVQHEYLLQGGTSFYTHGCSMRSHPLVRQHGLETQPHPVIL